MPGVHPLSRIRIAGVLAGALLLALVFAGCDSASDPEPMPSPTVQPSPTATVENGSALPLERFHYVAALSIREANPDGEPDDVVVSTEGDFQAPDRHAFTYTTQLGEATVQESVVIVDLLAWHRRGDEPWRAVNVRHLLATEETINGIPAHRYEVGVPGREFFESFLASPQLLEIVQDLNWQLWLARDGAWPVRLLATATVTPSLALLENLGLQAPTAWELRVDISRPNDPTLMVVEPAADG
jgi:hypothetical protein